MKRIIYGTHEAINTHSGKKIITPKQGDTTGGLQASRPWTLILR